MTRCTFLSGRWSDRCDRPAVGAHVSRSSATSSMSDSGRVYCARHLATMRRRDDVELAPHVHKAWPSKSVRTRPDGTMIAFCANCGAVMFDTAKGGSK